MVRERRLPGLVIGLTATFLIAILGNLVLALSDARQEVLLKATHTAQNLAQALEQHTAGSVNAAEIALNGTVKTLQLLPEQTPANRAVIDDLLAETIRNLPFVRAIWVLDADGNMIYDSENLPGRYNLADRLYFRVHRPDPDVGLFIDHLTLSKHGVWFIPVSLRVARPDGSFGGVVAAALEPEYLRRFYRSLDVGKEGVVALMRTDGSLLQRVPTVEGAMGRDLVPPPRFVKELRSSATGCYTDRSRLDQVTRLYCYRRVPETPLVIVLGLGVAESLAEWRATAKAYVLGSLVLVLISLSLGAMVLQELRRRKVQEVRIQRLNRVQEVLSEINALIVRVTSRQDLFEESCRIAVEQGRFGVAWIHEMDASQRSSRPVILFGSDAEASLSDLASADGIPAQWDVIDGAIATRGLMFDNDLVVDAQGNRAHLARAIRLGYRSVIALPLLLHGKVTATLTLLAKERDFFDEAEVKLLTELANDISFALDHLAAQEHIDYVALHDVLTDLPNRALFVERMTQFLAQARQNSSLAAVVRLDVERFRSVNDTLGRHAGDALLKEVAARLQAAAGALGLVARTERDHFVFVIAGIRDAAGIALAAKQVVNECFGPVFSLDGMPLHIVARTGIAVFPADGDDADTLLRNAEAALVISRNTSGRFVFYARDMNARLAESLAIENKLRDAVQREQFLLHYQLKFDARSGAISGMEALLRWQDPDNGLVLPSTFIPILEETGLILEVGTWVMRRAVQDYRRWSEMGLRPPRVAVNVSELQLRQENFVTTVRAAIGLATNNDHGMDIELTESMLMHRVESNIDKLSELRKLGLKISIDDFGTGYSSLLYIAKLPLDTLKIDRSFIIKMTESTNDRAVVAAVISLAHQLGLTVVAEGVDSEDQVQLLKKHDCDEFQGFLFARPVPSEAIEAVLRKLPQ